MGSLGGRPLRARTVVVIAAAVALLAGATYLVATWPPGRTRPVAAFVGDSYTAGFSVSVQERRWTTLVAEEQGWEESNYGEVGSGYVTEGYGRSYLATAEEVVDARPDVVFVAGGQNDIGSNADVTAAVRATLLRLRDGLPDAELYVLGPTWPEPQPPQRLVEIDAAAKRAAAEVDARYIPALDVIAGRPDLIAPDKIHPNDAGHRAIADRVLTALDSG